MSTPNRKPSDLTDADLACSEFFREADRDTLQAFQHVLCARIAENVMGFPEPRVDWTEFEQELLRFCDLARIRHAAKHAAVREAMYATPIVVLRDDEGRTRMLEMIKVDPDLVELLKKK